MRSGRIWWPVLALGSGSSKTGSSFDQSSSATVDDSAFGSMDDLYETISLRAQQRRQGIPLEAIESVAPEVADIAELARDDMQDKMDRCRLKNLEW